MRKEKGFTLVEVIVVMSVLFIVIGLTIMLTEAFNGISKKNAYQYACETDFQRANSFVEEFLNGYSYSPYQIKEVSLHSIVITDTTTSGASELTYTLSYTSLNNSMSAQIKNNSTNSVDSESLKFENIIDIKFSNKNSVVKCEFVFESYPTYTTIIKFGAD